jgi:microcystin degradation protein MlrC
MTAPSPVRLAVLHFSHETVTFLKNDTTREDFIYPGSPAKGEALLKWDPKSYMGGFVKMAREFDGVELVGIESPLWPKTGTGSGWVTLDAYETFVGRMIAEIKADGPFNGVYLCLHGAMAVRGIARPEAELARRVRETVGPNVFIAATFDPHGNEDEAFLKQADLAFTVKYFPHYDITFRESAPRARWCGRSGATTSLRMRPSSCRSFHPPCCNGPAPRPGWTWSSARWSGRPANPTSTSMSSSAFRLPTCLMSE